MTEAQETMLGRMMLAFEREQWKKKLRPRLPCDLKPEEEPMIPSKQIMRDEKTEARERVFNYVKTNMIGRTFDCDDVAKALGIHKNSAGNYLRQMEAAGMVTALPKRYTNRIRYAI